MKKASARNFPCVRPPSRDINMTDDKLRGVIAAIATAVDATGEPDVARSTALARYLLANGCDGLNVLGTTGVATSFSTPHRVKVMTDYGEADLPLVRLLRGTGAAARDSANEQ